ncbi:MAG: ATP-binding protein [Clostridia bacterium]|nr:ATP-binding protein [Clostridia bacterium]MCD8308668.1 ATP-binding protein [Clostridia bacterium]
MITFSVDNLKDMNDSLKAFSDFLRQSNVGEDDIFDSRLVSCELISNVLVHLGERADFCGKISGKNIIITVSSPHTAGAIEPQSVPDVFAERGRGLYIVKTISGGNVSFRDGAVEVLLKIKDNKI